MVEGTSQIWADILPLLERIWAFILWAWPIALWVMAIWVGLSLLAIAFQAHLLYHPYRKRIDPKSVGLDQIEEDWMDTPDGERLLLWRAKPRHKDGPILVYLHGNQRHLAHRARFFRLFLNAGWGFVALSHRGFGGSTGWPSEKRNVRDAITLLEHLSGEGLDPQRFVLYGESMGSGTAVQAAASHPIGGLILHAPYDSVLDMARIRVPFILPRLFLRERWHSIAYIAQVTAPLLWLHGDKDRIVPQSRGRRLYDAASGPKYAGLVKGANHFGIYTQAVFNHHIRFFVEGIVKAQETAPFHGPMSYVDPACPREKGPLRLRRQAPNT